MNTTTELPRTEQSQRAVIKGIILDFHWSNQTEDDVIEAIDKMYQELSSAVQKAKEGAKIDENTSDGYHTFKELVQEIPGIDEAIQFHCIKYEFTDEDGSKREDLALPIGWVKEWMKIAVKQAKAEGIAEGRIDERFTMMGLYYGVLQDLYGEDIAKIVQKRVGEVYKLAHQEGNEDDNN